MLLATLRDEDGLGGGESGVVVMGDMICGCWLSLSSRCDRRCFQGVLFVAEKLGEKRRRRRYSDSGQTWWHWTYLEVVDGTEIDRDRAASSIHPPDAKGPTSLLCAPGQWGPNVELLAVRLDQTVDAVV